MLVEVRVMQTEDSLYQVGMKQALKLLAKREYSRRLLCDKLMVKGIV